jgi:hypothetical protein
MQRTQERDIDGVHYVCSQFPATKGLKMTHRLGRFISAPLSALAGDMKPGMKLTQADFGAETIGKAVQSFFESCDEAIFESTVKELLTSTTRDNKPINFDIDFAGQLGHLLKVLAFILEVNFKDFFSGIGGLKSI